MNKKLWVMIAVILLIVTAIAFVELPRVYTSHTHEINIVVEIRGGNCSNILSHTLYINKTIYGTERDVTQELHTAYDLIDEETKSYASYSGKLFGHFTHKVYVNVSSTSEFGNIVWQLIDKLKNHGWTISLNPPYPLNFKVLNSATIPKNANHVELNYTVEIYWEYDANLYNWTFTLLEPVLGNPPSGLLSFFDNITVYLTYNHTTKPLWNNSKLYNVTFKRQPCGVKEAFTLTYEGDVIKFTPDTTLLFRLYCYPEGRKEVVWNEKYFRIYMVG